MPLADSSGSILDMSELWERHMGLIYLSVYIQVKSAVEDILCTEMPTQWPRKPVRDSVATSQNTLCRKKNDSEEKRPPEEYYTRVKMAYFA